MTKAHHMELGRDKVQRDFRIRTVVLEDGKKSTLHSAGHRELRRMMCGDVKGLSVR